MFRSFPDSLRACIVAGACSLLALGSLHAQTVNLDGPQLPPAVSRIPQSLPPGSGSYSTARPTVSTTATAIRREEIVRMRERAQNNAFSYPGRPILAVGTLKEINVSSKTLTIDIDRKLSSMPEALIAVAKRIGTEQQLIDREFAPERTFHLGPAAMYFDARLDPSKPQTRATSGHIAEDKQRLQLKDFTPGDHISVLYRMPVPPSTEAVVLNVSKVDPTQTVFDADSNPVGAGVRVERHVDPLTGRTTSTIVRSAPQAAPFRR